MLKYIQKRINKRDDAGIQKGVNMVDAMIWMIIAALLATFTIQSIHNFRTAAIIYQMKSDIKGAADLAAARAVLTGFLAEDEVAYSVDYATKSEGISLSWGKFDVAEESTAGTAEEPQPQALGGYSIQRASLMTPTEIESTTVQVNKSFVLVARHKEAPEIRVMYFFADVFVYDKGEEVLAAVELPPIQDMFNLPPSDAPAEGDGAVGPQPQPTATQTPTITPTPTAEATPTSGPEVIESPTPTPTPTASGPASTSPTPTAAPSPSATSTPVSDTGSTAPEYTATPPKDAEDPTPEPDPLTPAANFDKKTKDFLFCHGDMMHSNSFQGMIQGHEHHPDDIMPPIPAKDYPGWNWTWKTAKIYYNNCKPVS